MRRRFADAEADGFERRIRRAVARQCAKALERVGVQLGAQRIRAAINGESTQPCDVVQLSRLSLDLREHGFESSTIASKERGRKRHDGV